MRPFHPPPALVTAIGLLVILASPVSLQAAGASVRGVVIDSTSGATLPGATIYIPLLGRGVIADDNGRFRLDGLKAGYYQIEASVVGYVQWRQNDLWIGAEDTTALTIALIPTVLPLGEEIIVIGRRPPIAVAVPSTRRTVERQDLDLAPLALTELVLRQPGVTQVDREIHIRGARTYETDYRVDGVSVADPFLRQGMAVRPPTSAVEAVTVVTGGLSADLTSAAAGAVLVETIEPTPTLRGQVEYSTDRLSPQSAGDWNTDRAALTLTGPLRALGLPIAASDPRFAPGFVLSVSGDLTDTYLGSGRPNSLVAGGTRWTPRSDNRYHALAKLGWRLNPVHRVSALFTAETNIDQDAASLDTRLRTATFSYGWPFAYARHLENATTFTRQSNSQILRWSIRPGQRTGLELSVARVFARLHGDVNGKAPAEYIPPQDTGPIRIDSTPGSQYYTVHAGDGFYDVGDGDLWHDHFSETYTARADADVRFSPSVSLQTGAEVAPQTLQVIDIFRPWLGLGGLNTDHYRVSPTSASAWAQIEANIQGTVLNIGLRGELWWPGAYLDQLMGDTTLPNITARMREKYLDETIELFGGRARGWVMPRIGVAHALGPSMSLFVSYDRLAQRPNPRHIYAKLRSRSPSSYQLLGNPALETEKTIAIEGGIKWLYTPDWGLTASVYQRDVRDYIAAVAVIPDPDHPEDYWYAYANRDIAQSRGIELTLDGRRGNTFRTNLSAAFARIRGEHSSPEDVFRGRISRDGTVLYQEIAFDWDKPWRFASTFDWTYGPDDSPRLFGIGIGGNWDFHIGLWAEAGKRYTPYRDSTDEDGDVHYLRDGDPNSAVGPHWRSLDLSVAKHFSVGRNRLSLLMSVTNLFNHENVALINPITGEVYRAEDPVPVGDNFFETAPVGYELPIWADPSRFDNPVHWQFGIRWSW